MVHNPIVKSLQGAEILWNRRQGLGYYRMGFRCESRIKGAEPGQFVMVRLVGQRAPLLRRPFSIHQVISDKGHIHGLEILYKVVGDGTALLSGCREGDGIDVLGPLGRGFTLNHEDKTIYIVAGGIGVAPFLFMATRMYATGFDMSRVVLFLGGRSKDDLLCIQRFKTSGMALRLATDDGSRGERGLVTAILEDSLKTKRPDRLYACGPVPMLRKVIALAKDIDLPCQVSIETVMACGMGACLGCAVMGKSTDGSYRHVCVDGPVFNADDIIL